MSQPPAPSPWTPAAAVTVAVLKSLRGDLTQEAFAIRLAEGGFTISRATLSRWEHGSDPGVGDYHAIEKALGMALGAALLRQVRTIDALHAAGVVITDFGDPLLRLSADAVDAAVERAVISLGQLA